MIVISSGDHHGLAICHGGDRNIDGLQVNHASGAKARPDTKIDICPSFGILELHADQRSIQTACCRTRPGLIGIENDAQTLIHFLQDFGEEVNGDHRLTGRICGEKGQLEDFGTR